MKKNKKKQKKKKKIVKVQLGVDLRTELILLLEIRITMLIENT